MSPRSVATTNLHDRTNLINFSRCLLIILIGYTAFQLDYLDATIKHYWDNVLYQSKLFRLDSFEVICSSLLFAFYSFGWLILDYYIPAAHAFRISSNSTNQSWKGRESALSQETLWYTLPWIFFDLIVPRRHILFAEFVAAPSFLQLVRDICLSLVLYDFFFYIGHRTMHRNRYLLRSIHSKHHQMGEHIRGGDAVRHTFLDGIFDVMCSVVALKIVHAHPLSRSIFNVIAILLISEAHSGYDFPWSAHNVFPFFAGPVLHRQHHKKGSSNFGKFFIWCDYCCGTLSYDI